MAFYENFMTDQPWPFRTDFSDAWFSDGFTEDTDTLTAALQGSFSGNSSNAGDPFSPEIVESLFDNPVPMPKASENEIAVAKPRRGGVPPSGRVAKRKSRVSKRSATTTFISADPANFRRMVQQVTGVRLDAGAERIDGVNWGGGLLPTTLDAASSFLPSSYFPGGSGVSQAAGGGGSAADERLIDSFCSFPTLESWKAT